MNFVEIFNDSYERTVARDHNGFFKKFYENFVKKSPEIAEAFANTDMRRQISMLEHSLMMMIDFASNRSSSEYLDRLAAFHQEKQIKEHLYSMWLDALLETVKQVEPHFDSNEDLAWRVMLSPGIEFMKRYKPS